MGSWGQSGASKLQVPLVYDLIIISLAIGVLNPNSTQEQLLMEFDKNTCHTILLVVVDLN